MQKIVNANTVRVAIVDEFAYWVKDNQLYKSDINEYGRLDIENATPIDAFSLNEKEAKKLLKIVDSLSN